MRNHAEKPSFMPDAEPRHDSSEIVHEAHEHYKQSKKTGLTYEQLREKVMASKKFKQMEEDKKNLKAAEIELARAAEQPTMAYGEKDNVPFQEPRATVSKPAVKVKEALPHLPPMNKETAILDAQSEITPPPHTFWGKIADRARQIFDPHLRDIRANQKFASMSADTDETSADRKAAQKGAEMMQKLEEREDKEQKRRAIDQDEVALKQNIIKRKIGERQIVREDVAQKKFEAKFDKMEAHKALAEPEDTMSPQAAKNKRLVAERAAAEAGREEQNAIRGEKFKKVGERLEKMNDRISKLAPIIGDIRIGFLDLTKLSIDDETRQITNLPLHEQGPLLEKLSQKQTKAEKKGRTEDANKFKEQKDGLAEYLDLLVEIEKLLAGQTPTDKLSD